LKEKKKVRKELKVVKIHYHPILFNHNIKKHAERFFNKLKIRKIKSSNYNNPTIRAKWIKSKLKEWFNNIAFSPKMNGNVVVRNVYQTGVILVKENSSLVQKKAMVE
jgi:hypothetical protein